MKELIEPYDESIAISRNQTNRSVFAERLVDTFIKYGAAAATVNWQQTDYSLDELHRGLWNVSQKEPYKHMVRVTKRGEKLILLRKVKHDTCNR